MRTQKNHPAKHARRDAGFTLIEVLLAGVVITVCAIGILTLVITAIANNTRSKHDSTQTMLATAIAEQVSSTLVGGGTANLTDCAGTNFTINTATGGSKLQGSGTHPNDSLGNAIDFTEASPPANYNMTYIVTSPCQAGGNYVATYDVRWHVDQIGTSASTPTNSFLLTVSARQKGASSTSPLAGLYFAPAVTVHFVVGKPE